MDKGDQRFDPSESQDTRSGKHPREDSHIRIQLESSLCLFIPIP
jgi:hypothetical protein